MRSKPELSRVVRSWLREDGHEDAERVLFLVLEQLDTTPQRRAGWLAWRFPLMHNTTFRYGVAAVVIVAAAFLGFRFLPGGVGGPPSPTPSPTRSLTPTASSIRALPEGSLEGGRYMLDHDLGISVEAPAGWQGCCPNSEDEISVIVNPNLPGFAAFGLFDVTEISIYEDSCRWQTSATSEPRGAMAIAEGLSSLEGRRGARPEAVIVAGQPTLHLQLTVPTDLLVEATADGNTRFVECDLGEYRTWDTADGETRYHQGAGQVDELYILDLERTVVLLVTYFDDTTAAQHDELDAMLDSVRIE